MLTDSKSDAAMFARKKKIQKKRRTFQKSAMSTNQTFSMTGGRDSVPFMDESHKRNSYVEVSTRNFTNQGSHCKYNRIRDGGWGQKREPHRKTMSQFGFIDKPNTAMISDYAEFDKQQVNQSMMFSNEFKEIANTSAIRNEDSPIKISQLLNNEEAVLQNKFLSRVKSQSHRVSEHSAFQTSVLNSKATCQEDVQLVLKRKPLQSEIRDLDSLVDNIQILKKDQPS